MRTIATLLLAALSIDLGAATYEPTWESLDTHPIPGWFQDARFGIFIHWGVYSVPSWGPKGQYAEWYWNHLQAGVKGRAPADTKSETWKFHAKTYGENFLYRDFAPLFRCEMFDASRWADIFARSGARYVVLTSKHHDGFCLFPSEQANRSWGHPWNSADVGPRRDLLGELTEAVRAKGLKMGFYYSLYEWYNPLWLADRKTYIEKHMFPQFKDVVSRYKPAIIFSDGEWDLPSSEWRSEELLAWLFNESPVKEDVVLNDRWGKETRHVHGDYFTTEYTSGLKDSKKPWEESRGMGHSYGYNRFESLADYKPARELLLMLIDLVCRGGNLLLDIGPAADGTIPVVMEERLIDMGAWLAVNGEAIYGTRPWRANHQWTAGAKPTIEYGGQYMVKYEIGQVTGKAEPGKAVIEAFFTCKGATLYAIAPRWPGPQFTIRDVTTGPDTKAFLLGVDAPLPWRAVGKDLVIDVPNISDNDRITQRILTFKLTSVK